MSGSASNAVSDVGQAAADTAAFFTGGASGANAVSGATGGPTVDTSTAATADVAGLGAGAGLAASGLAAGGAAMPPAVAETGAMMPAAVPPTDPTFGGAFTETAPGVFTAGAAAGDAATEGAGGTAILSAATPTVTLDPTTAAALGIDTSSFVGDLPIAADTVGSTGMGTLSGGFDAGMMSTVNPDYVGDLPIDSAAGAGGDGTFGGAKMASDFAGWIAKNPAQAALLGLTGYNMTRTPKIPEAAKTLQNQATPAAAAAQATIASGGTNTPAWTQQKSSIDASVDQQIKDQVRQVAQNAANTGQGTFDIDNWAKGGAPKPGDSLAAIQQANSIKDKLEAQRQQLYLQAQQQNVSDALKNLGISDTALAQVADSQFSASKDAQQTAAQTASLVLMLSAMGK